MKRIIGSAIIGTILVISTISFIYFNPEIIDNQSDEKNKDPKSTVTALKTTPDGSPVHQPLEVDTLSYEGVEIAWLGFGGFKLKYKDVVVYLDPFQIDKSENEILEKADFIIASHHHADHYSTVDILALTDQDTKLFQSNSCPKSALFDYTIVTPDDKLEFDDVSFEFVPMYTVNKLRSSGVQYHPKSKQDIGVVIQFGDLRIYSTASSDRIEEMKEITADIIILPVSGRFYMDPEEAAWAVEDIKLNSDLKYAIPAQYGPHSISGLNQGSMYHVEQFMSHVDVQTVLLTQQIVDNSD